jgi:hypothetical protein
VKYDRRVPKLKKPVDDGVVGMPSALRDEPQKDSLEREINDALMRGSR